LPTTQLSCRLAQGTKLFELAVLFIRLFRSLDAIVLTEVRLGAILELVR
jgi:hypothetical protein